MTGSNHYRHRLVSKDYAAAIRELHVASAPRQGGRWQKRGGIDMTVSTTHFSTIDAQRIGAEIGIDWDAVPFDVEQFRLGLEVELEHGAHDAETDVTHDDPILTARIAWAHLKELPDYYTRLAVMEAEAEA
jgi:Protein of unknown function (DUF5661)